MRIYTVSYAAMRRLIPACVIAVVTMLGVLMVQHDRLAVISPVVVPPKDRYSLRDVVTTHKVAALTFDISWGTTMPRKVFRILQHDDVKVTFFISGPWAEHNATLVQDMVRAGDEVESHGWAHVNYTSLSNQGIQANIMRANQAIEKITGIRPAFVRPPNGDFSARTILAAKEVGYTTVTWGTDSLDWMNPGVSTIIRRVMTGIHPGDIVLMHASDTCKQTDLALPTILADLRQRGYQLVTLTQLLRYGHPNYRG
ncbi:MAG: polysaccharide deacetylase [Sulfobacillus acidophilus]|uniref:Polysaccharide deacetylase n=1 Tax=Sulfobacillus acidophilus TaxID=53633 RepID=A0A2T2WNL5_9FIRM|nr:MAG: polysaccharide deacetylase [Sulfobacillus acidophilus]